MDLTYAVNKWWTPHVQYNSPYDITLFFAESALCSSSSIQQNMLRMRANMKRPSWLADSRRNGTMRDSTTLYRRDSTRCELSRGRNRDSPGRQQIVFSPHGYSQFQQLDNVTVTNKGGNHCYQLGSHTVINWTQSGFLSTWYSHYCCQISHH